jgi:hypothetical protein
LPVVLGQAMDIIYESAELVFPLQLILFFQTSLAKSPLG